MQDDHGQEREGEAEGVDESVGYVRRVEERLQEMGERRLGDGSEGEGADGDAELGGGHHLRQVLQAVQDRAGPAGALGGERFDLAAAYGDEGELGADEEAVRRYEEGGEEELEHAHRAASSSAGAALSGRGSGIRVKRTRSARLWPTWRTEIRQPGRSARSPGAGMRPSSPATSPATVS